MNRETFLSQLKEALADMPEAERKDVLDYFEELILDKAADMGVPEESVIAELGSVQDVASAVRASAGSAGTAPESPPEPLDDGEMGDLVFTGDAAQVRSLVMRVSNSRVNVHAGKDDQVVIHYTQTRQNRYTVSVENGELVFEQIKPASLLAWGIGVFLEPARPIEVFLPKGFAGKANLVTSNAKMRWEDVSAWGSLMLKSSNGAVDIERAQAKELTATTSNGRITIEQVEAQGAITLSTSNGKVEATKVRAAAVSLRTSNGSVHVQDVKADDITLRTSNGGIDGVIAGSAQEYTVTSGTSNGKNNLRGHAHTGPKRLSAHTSNASIRLEFAQDAPE